MIDKHQISGTVDLDVCFMKYNYETGILSIGGHSDCIDFIDSVVEQHVVKVIPDNTHSQRSRIRYEVKLSRKKYRALKEQLSETYTEGFTKIDQLERRL